MKEIHRQRMMEQSKREEYELAKMSAIEHTERRKLQEIASKEAERLKQEQQKSKWMTFNASYYDPDCDGCSGVSAAGIDVGKSVYYDEYRIIAADTNIVHLWTIVEIQTPNETFQAIVLDTGGQ